MADLARLTPALFTGADLPDDHDLALEDLREWERFGITHVIDTRIEWSDEHLVVGALPSVRYLHIGVDDLGQQMPDDWFDRGVGFALDAWHEDPDAVVVAHCHMGINRGPSMAYAILLGLGWDPVEAMDLIRRQRPIAGVDYAEDALSWHLRRSRVPDHEHRAARSRLLAFRKTSPIHAPRITKHS
ncbi:MAG: dual specificity protein phosphatase [Acidimicrobiales bacterium]|nr:dual specificity protein phosphatase [Acidimicrobiales bacterium]